jgi:hypothetical protein
MRSSRIRPNQMAVLRAMLLGHRAFVDSETVTAFQKTAAYHVLVVAGLHVGALAVFFFWLGRRLRLSVSAASLVTFLALAAYVGMVQDRPPLLRAALMSGGFFLFMVARDSAPRRGRAEPRAPRSPRRPAQRDSNFRVGQAWVGRDEETAAFERWFNEARDRVSRLFTNQRVANLNWGGIAGSVLGPADETAVAEASNDDSVTLRLKDDRVGFLLPGDIQKKVEQRLVAEHAELEADFLKVPHQGSKTSSTPDFLAAVAPKVAVVSAGEANPFGHPAPSTIERYSQAGVKLLRTETDGAVTATADGHTLTVTTFAESLPN